MPFKKKTTVNGKTFMLKSEFYLTHVLLLENLIKYFQIGNF